MVGLKDSHFAQNVPSELLCIEHDCLHFFLAGALSLVPSHDEQRCDL